MSEAVVSKPVSSKLTGDERFVVKSTLGNPLAAKPFEPGQVIYAKQLDPKGEVPPIENIHRLTRLGAIRPALDHEKEHDYVDLKKTEAPGKSLTDQVTDLNNANAKLTARCEELSAEVESLKVSKSADYDPQKDQLVEELRKADQEALIQVRSENTNLKGQIESLNRKLQNKGK